MELREQIIAAIQKHCTVWREEEVVGEDEAADAILALPEIRDVLRERHEQLGVATKLGRI